MQCECNDVAFEEFTNHAHTTKNKIDTFTNHAHTTKNKIDTFKVQKQ